MYNRIQGENFMLSLVYVDKFQEEIWKLIPNENPEMWGATINLQATGNVRIRIFNESGKTPTRTLALALRKLAKCKCKEGMKTVRIGVESRNRALNDIVRYAGFRKKFELRKIIVYEYHS